MKLVKALALLLVPLLLTSFLATMPPAYASKPITISGTLTTANGDMVSFRQAGSNLFISWVLHDDWYAGDLSGAYTGTADDIVHGWDGSSWTWLNFREVHIFDTATVTLPDGSTREGGLTLLLVGKTVNIGGLLGYEATVRILSGTGGLANLHGQGTAWSAPTDIYEYYQLQVHFDP